jgi:hypothetical protein
MVQVTDLCPPMNHWFRLKDGSWLQNKRVQISAGCIVLFALNALFCWRLFRVEYLNNLGSNEGTFITFARFLLANGVHSGWFPWFNVGLPFENTYLPLTAFLTALGASLARCSPAHAFHFIAALAFSLAPVFWFLFARKVSGRMAPAFGAALLWSLFSPALPIRRILENDMASPWGSRRLSNIVNYGETPHNLALCLLPLALLALAVYLEKPTVRNFAVAALAVGVAMLTNAFGIVVLAFSAVMLVLARAHLRFRHLLSAGAILLAGYLFICRFLPPSLIQLMRINSPTVGGDFRLTSKSRIFAVLFALALAAVAILTRRFSDPMLRFATLFSACFGGIAVMWYWKRLTFVPQPHRYDLEMELGFCLLAAFSLDSVFRRLPRRVGVVFVILCIPAFGWLAVQDYWFGRHLIHPLKMDLSPPFEEARWIDTHLPGQRVLIAEYGPWFNLFSDNPQFSSGHDPTAPNWMQGVAVWLIESGKDAGDRDGRGAVFWLTAFGCGALTVQGPASPDPRSPISQPERFDALIPLLLRDRYYSIYQVPQRSTSLAHVIPASAIVTRRPIHGLDLDPARAYVSALQDPSLPLASLAWKNPVQGRITARLTPEQVVSLQMTYDRGWRASVGGRSARIHADQLGMIVIEPDCSGDCTVDVEFTGGEERQICTVVGSLTGIILFGAVLMRAKRSSPAFMPS